VLSICYVMVLNTSISGSTNAAMNSSATLLSQNKCWTRVTHMLFETIMQAIPT
jgi:hypothetical protein